MVDAAFQWLSAKDKRGALRDRPPAGIIPRVPPDVTVLRLSFDPARSWLASHPVRSFTVMQPFFLPVDDKFLAKQVSQAADRVFFSASGVSQALADAIVTAARTRPALQLVVVLDASSLPARMGLADTSGLEILHSAQPDLPNLSVQQSPSLRLCVMVTDARGWVWWPVVQAVEPPRVSQAPPNAMGLRPDQVDYVLASFSADSRRLASLPSANADVSPSRPPPLPEDSTVVVSGIPGAVHSLRFQRP